MTRRSRLMAYTLSALLCAPALSACGIKGELKTPPPIFGQDKAAKPLPTAPVEGQTTNKPE